MSCLTRRADRIIVFDPKKIFRNYYRLPCETALREINNDDFAGAQTTKIEFEFRRLFQELSHTPSAGLRVENLRYWDRVWADLKLNRTCLFCVVRMPQHVLACGHSICDECVKIFGRAVVGNEYQFTMPLCLLCSEKAKVLIQLKPPTAGVRMLAIDGGGTRGVIPLEYLRQIDQALGTHGNIRDLFDVAFGTSSGELMLKICAASITANSI